MAVADSAVFVDVGICGGSGLVRTGEGYDVGKRAWVLMATHVVCLRRC